MTKREIISYLIKEWAKNYPQESDQRKNLYYKVDYLLNCIDRRNKKEDIENIFYHYHAGLNIQTVMCCILDMKQIRKALYN